MALEDYTANYGSPLTLDSTTDWQYNPSNNAELGYYQEDYAYDGGQDPAATYQQDYNPASQEIGSVASYYNPSGYVTNQDVGLYGSTGAYLGAADSSLDYGAGNAVVGSDMSVYNPYDVATGYQQNSYAAAAGGGLASTYDDFNAGGDPYASAAGAYDSGDVLASYQYDDGGNSYAASFDSAGDPLASSGDWSDPGTDYSDYADYAGSFAANPGAASSFAAAMKSAAEGGTSPFAGPAAAATAGATVYYSTTQPTAAEQTPPAVGSTSAAAAPASVITPSSTVPTVDLSADGSAFPIAPGQLFIARLGDFQASGGGNVTSYDAVINWGDGTISAGIETALAGGGFAVVGTHSYAAAGSYQISAAVTDATGREVTDFAAANVAPTGPTVSGVSPATGPLAGGTSVTITGSGFTGETAVHFGSAAATNVLVNAAGTQITATSPAGAAAGTVDVTVTGPGGVSVASPADKFTYTAADSLGVYSGGYWYFNVNGTTQIVASPAGWAGATPVVGDWNGDGKTEIGLFLNGNWWLDTNEDGTLDSGDAQFSFGFSSPNVVPVVGDWNGGGKTDVGVYADGAWFRDVDGSHTWDATNQAALAYLGWNDGGTHTVIPVPGNWAGDGKTEMGVYCQGVWFLDSTGSNQWDGGHTYWGWAGTLIPVVGNWSGTSAKSQFGVYNQGVWFLDYDNTHTWDAANQAALAYYGWSGALPVVGNWGNGLVAAARQAASGVQSPISTATQLQPDAGPAGSAQLGGPSPAGNAPSAPAPLMSQLPPLDPQAVDRIDLSAVADDGLRPLAGLPDLAAAPDLLTSNQSG